MGVLVWALVGPDGESSTSTTETGIGPVALSAPDLKTTAKALGQPVYWVGPKQGYTYEYTQTADQKTYVRYLPAGTEVGDARSDFLVIATYPFPNALAALEKVSQGKAIKVRGGGIAVVDQTYPESVHIAFPGVDYQVEVYDPSPRRARAEATSGDLAPVG